MTGAKPSLNLLTRKNVVAISAIRQLRPLNNPLTPFSCTSDAPVPRMLVYFFCSTSPCMHVLMVSMGWVTVAEKKAPSKDPTARPTLGSILNRSMSSRCITGVAPNMAIVNKLSRPIVMMVPRPSTEMPCAATILCGAPMMEPPKRCCWIMVSSHKLHGIPDIIPPQNAAVICCVELIFSLPAINFWKTPTDQNCTAVVPPRLRQAINSPRYTTGGLNEIGRPCCVAFFQFKSG
mmetsp:Transcript_16221/g.38879  ORF Transcript_16221/g.38879 Transcript_16221/m.38879 type:complete len:234 (+) Transcript_16221:1698-2399(+)